MSIEGYFIDSLDVIRFKFISSLKAQFIFGCQYMLAFVFLFEELCIYGQKETVIHKLLLLFANVLLFKKKIFKNTQQIEESLF